MPPLRSFLGIRDRLSAGGSVALTFDDGPHPEGTPAVLEVLAAAGAHATFFLVGEQVERRPALAVEIVARGHQVGLHCHRHRNLLRLTPLQLRDDFRRALAAIGSATGKQPELYRPPYGVFTAAALVLGRWNRLTPLLWSRSGQDWERRATARSIALNLTHQLQARDVLLLHDADFYGARGSWRRTVEALPLVLEAIGRSGLTLVAADRASLAS